MRFAVSVGLSLILALTGTAAAGEKAGVTMSDTAEVAGKQLTLNGMGLREATLKIDVYVAGLYLEQVSSSPKTIISSKQVKKLTLAFVRDVDRKDILDAWHDGFTNNATVKLSAIKGQMDKLDSWMTDMSEGDTLSFTYVPDKGVRVDINGSTKGTIMGDDFASSLFAIWFGSKPPSEALKAGLLGNH